MIICLNHFRVKLEIFTRNFVWSKFFFSRISRKCTFICLPNQVTHAVHFVCNRKSSLWISVQVREGKNSTWNIYIHAFAKLCIKWRFDFWKLYIERHTNCNSFVHSNVSWLPFFTIFACLNYLRFFLQIYYSL